MKILAWIKPEPKDRPNELRTHEWVTLDRLWQSVRPVGAGNEAVLAIDDLIEMGKSTHYADNNWSKFNEAEMKVGQFLPQPILAAEFQSLLNLASDRKLPSYAAHVAKLPIMQSVEAADVDRQRATYQSLLYELQSAFISRRYLRNLRHTVVTMLMNKMKWTLGAALLAAVACDALKTPILKCQVTIAPSVLLIIPVLAFGALGANFSRVLSFQRTIKSLSFDDMMDTYMRNVLWLRVAFGAVAALVLFLFLQSGSIEGSLFPDLSAAQSNADATKLGRTPDQNFALLLLWSFLAAFSEILIPDALARLEKRQAPATEPPA